MAANINTNQSNQTGALTTNASTTNTSTVPTKVPPPGESHVVEVLIIGGVLVAIALFIWLGGINIIKKIFGTKREREVRKIRSDLVPRVNEIEEKLQLLPDESLRKKTAAWKERLSQIEDLSLIHI